MSEAPIDLARIEVRDAVPGDIPAITAIYRPAVVTGTASFELEPPDADEMLKRYQTVTGGGFPYIVAALDGVVLGYAYFSQYRPRPAYRYSVENSIYVAPEAQGKSVGKILLAALIERATARGHRQMIAVIGDAANWPSIGLHRAMGFRFAGTIHSVGFKHGRWLDSVMMQLPLGAGDTTVPD